MLPLVQLCMEDLRKNIVLYNSRGMWPLRCSISNFVFCMQAMYVQLNLFNPNLSNPNLSLIGTYVKSPSLRNPCKKLTIIRISL